MWAAALIVLGQAITIGTLLYFVRTFGSYTSALREAHRSNMLVYQQAVKILEHAHQTTQDAA